WLDAQAGICGPGRARDAGELAAIDCFADVGRAEVEVFGVAEVNADAVEKFGVERLDPDDAVAARLVILLGQQHAIEPGRDRLVVDRFHEVDRTIETRNPGAASADVRLHDGRTWERFGRSRPRIAARHDASLG